MVCIVIVWNLSVSKLDLPNDGVIPNEVQCDVLEITVELWLDSNKLNLLTKWVLIKELVDIPKLLN